jgi:uncharacterized protein YgiM (DUF1202 family)
MHDREMTVRLSPHKISRILKYYFKGLPQPTIAGKVGVDQSTVSLYSSRFKELAAEIGLLDAGKEFKLYEEVSELRSLSVELMKANLTAEDARQGTKIIEAFRKLGVEPDQHVELIRIINRVRDQGFIEAAIKLARIEADGKMSYQETVSEFERISSELPVVKEELEEIKVERTSLKNILEQSKKEIARRRSELAQLEEEFTTKKAKLKRELETDMKRLSVKQQEINEVAKLKSKLAEMGLNIPALIKIAEEFIQ